MRGITNEEYEFYQNLEKSLQQQKLKVKEILQNFVIEEEKDEYDENLEENAEGK